MENELYADVAYWSRRLDYAVEKFKAVRHLTLADEAYQEADALVLYFSGKVNDARRIQNIRTFEPVTPSL